MVAWGGGIKTWLTCPNMEQVPETTWDPELPEDLAKASVGLDHILASAST